jgi:hypothetical protein
VADREQPSLQLLDLDELGDADRWFRRRHEAKIAAWF